MSKDLDVYQLREIERMEAYHEPNRYLASPRMIRLVNVLIAVLILAGMCLALIRVVRANPEDHALCRAMTQANVSGRVAEYISQSEGWRDMPSDLVNAPFLPVPLDAPVDGWEFDAGYDLKFSPSTMELWIFPHWSLEADETGTHNLCPVIIYDLNPEHR